MAERWAQLWQRAGAARAQEGVVAAALVAVAFGPLREQLQRGVDRLLYGERREPYSALARLGRRLDERLGPEKVLPAVVQTVAHSLRLPYVALTLASADSHPDEQAATGVRFSEPPAGSEAERMVRLPLTYRGAEVGQMVRASRPALCRRPSSPNSSRTSGSRGETGAQRTLAPRRSAAPG